VKAPSGEYAQRRHSASVGDNGGDYTTQVGSGRYRVGRATTLLRRSNL